MTTMESSSPTRDRPPAASLTTTTLAKVERIPASWSGVGGAGAICVSTCGVRGGPIRKLALVIVKMCVYDSSRETVL